jgi:hypothetical protein
MEFSYVRSLHWIPVYHSDKKYVNCVEFKLCIIRYKSIDSLRMYTTCLDIYIFNDTRNSWINLIKEYNNNNNNNKYVYVRNRVRKYKYMTWLAIIHIICLCLRFKNYIINNFIMIVKKYFPLNNLANHKNPEVFATT